VFSVSSFSKSSNETLPSSKYSVSDSSSFFKTNCSSWSTIKADVLDLVETTTSSTNA
jgi:hypothetical protein